VERGEKKEVNLKLKFFFYKPKQTNLNALNLRTKSG